MDGWGEAKRESFERKAVHRVVFLAMKYGGEERISLVLARKRLGKQVQKGKSSWWQPERDETWRLDGIVEECKTQGD
jgi:hypothetical protein